MMFCGDKWKITTALLLGSVALVMPQSAHAACDSSVPGAGATVTCTGLDTVGVSGGANDVTLRFEGASPRGIEVFGSSAIILGNSAQINITNANVTSDSNTIQFNNGHVTVAANSMVTSTTGVAIQGTSDTGTLRINANGVISGAGGTAIQYGNNRGILALNVSSATINGNVYAGSGTTDLLRLTSNDNRNFDVDLIGTQYHGFEQFDKHGIGTITLGGTGNQNWSVYEGTLRGDTTSVQGDIVNDSVFSFHQDHDGIYAGAMTGSGDFLKSGSGTVTLTGNNTYSGTTTITDGALSVSADSALGQGEVILDGGALHYNTTGTTPRIVTIGSNGGTIHLDQFSNSMRLSGSLRGSGQLEKTGDGALNLIGANVSHTGGILITGGRVYGDALTLQGDIINNASLFLSGNGGNVNATISGTGLLTKQDSTAMILTGLNSYSGGTLISNGVLSAAAEHNLGTLSGALRIGNMGTFRYDDGFSSARNVILEGAGAHINTQSFDATIAGTVSGSGGLNKYGAGALVLNGSNSYTGDTYLNQGSLFINGHNAQSAVFAAAGTTLGGGGTVGALTSEGVIEPGYTGNEYGTLQVDGNLVMNNSAVLRIATHEDGRASRMLVAGDAFLAGGLEILAGNGNYNQSRTYTIVEVAGGAGQVSGAFSHIATDLAFLAPSVAYGSDAVTLRLMRNSTGFSDLDGLSPYQAPIADAVEALGSNHPVYDAFVQLSASGAPDALQALSGQHQGNIVTGAKSSGLAVQNIVSSRYQKIRPLASTLQNPAHYDAIQCGAAGAPQTAHCEGFNAAKSWSDGLKAAQMNNLEPALGGMVSAFSNMPQGWVEIFGTYGRHNGSAQIASSRTHSGGVLFGMDIPVDDQLVAGVYGGIEQGRGKAAALHSSHDIRSYHGGVYASYFPDAHWRLSGSVGAASLRIETDRHISFTGFDGVVSGKTDGYALSSQIEAGYTWDGGVAAVAIEPYVGLHHVYSHIDGYTERGSPARLDMNSVSGHVWGHTLGVNIGRAFEIHDTLPPMRTGIHLGWVHNYGDLDGKSAASFANESTNFQTGGADLYRNAGKVGLGLAVPIAQDTEIYSEYDGVFSAQDHNQMVKLGVQFRF